MNKEKFIQYITKIGFNNFDPKKYSYKDGILKNRDTNAISSLTIESDYFIYSNSDIDCYIIFLVDNNINIFANDKLTGNRLMSYNGNEDKILEELKNFLKKEIRDILLNDIINS